MGGKYGTEELKKALKAMEEMTPEEYEALHQRALRSIKEIEEGIGSTQIYRITNPKTGETATFEIPEGEELDMKEVERVLGKPK